MADTALPFRADRDGLVLSVRLTPKAARESLDGIGTLSDGRQVLLARVRAVPEKGAANAALEALLAGALGLGKSLVRVEGGATARLKQVRVSGDAADLADRLRRLLVP
ncbi:DUF167 domain-containing protein [Microvirga tunisiensis]|uniref:UPF0235 protein GWI72_18985 n=1 Tax=Pannonibacter tanglangensis TaxID=2750084 RepID=A0A7X5JBF5_9HYPH|nr:DUF167 domain-containing protein [Pannonibacter sp. XCT-53]